MNLDLSPSKLKIKSNNYDTIFDTKNRWQSWLDVEAALAISQSKLGMIPKKVGKKIFSDISQFGYAHDIEILLICIKKKIKFIELPVEWSHKKDGKVNIISDSINMFLVIIKLKFKFFLY